MRPVQDRSGRRNFLKGSLLVGAATAAPFSASSATAATVPPPGPAPAPSHDRAEAETAPLQPEPDAAAQIVNPGSDRMVDLLKQAGVQYVAAMPGSTFRGLHESILNYGDNKNPELITCVHEEISAALAHGYAKVAGKPMACLVHSNVGLQHASMAIYNAWCDRAPVIVLAGNELDAAVRRPGVEWAHAQTDLATMVRDFTKWDDTPVSLQHFADSFMRAYELATTPPYEPVLLVVDTELQEQPVNPADLRIQAVSRVSPPAGDPDAIDRAAALLLAAKSPVIVAERAARTPAGLAHMVELAELLNAPVIDKFGRLNMPTDHVLNQSFRQDTLIGAADVILGLEVADLYGVLNSVPDLPIRKAHAVASPTAKVIAISAVYGLMKGNVQDIQRYAATDIAMDADAETCLPQLIASLRRQLRPEHQQIIAARAAPLRAAHAGMRAAAAADAAASWDSRPIATGRMCMELWAQIKDTDWALVSGASFASLWPQRLWDINKHHQFIGDSGGYGVGYNMPAAAGAALAHRDAGRLPVMIGGDGDLLVLPGTLWTLAHHQIPLLMIIQNNRAWHQETMHIQRMASRRNRGAERAPTGTLLTDPHIDFAQMAHSMGVWAEGPIDDPAMLAPALSRALAVVKSGKPALLDLVTQPR
ncbi:MAG: thiamine pyrophosphate-binding protein [Caulobacteraceae bacterium]